jgi:hypothetical protein
LKGCTIPVADVSPESAFETQTQAAAAVPRNIRWKINQLGNLKRKSAKRRARAREADTETRATQSDNDPAIQAGTTSSSALDGAQIVLGYPREALNPDEAIDQSEDLALALAPVPTSPGSIQPWIAPLSSQARMLMSHCNYPFSLSV